MANMERRRFRSGNTRWTTAKYKTVVILVTMLSAWLTIKLTTSVVNYHKEISEATQLQQEYVNEALKADELDIVNVNDNEIHVYKDEEYFEHVESKSTPIPLTHDAIMMAVNANEDSDDLWISTTTALPSENSTVEDEYKAEGLEDIFEGIDGKQKHDSEENNGFDDADEEVNDINGVADDGTSDEFSTPPTVKHIFDEMMEDESDLEVNKNDLDVPTTVENQMDLDKLNVESQHFSSVSNTNVNKMDINDTNGLDAEKDRRDLGESTFANDVLNREDTEPGMYDQGETIPDDENNNINNIDLIDELMKQLNEDTESK